MLRIKSTRNYKWYLDGADDKKALVRRERVFERGHQVRLVEGNVHEDVQHRQRALVDRDQAAAGGSED